MAPLAVFTQVTYKNIPGEIISVEEGFNYSPDGCMYMLELENGTYPILKRGEFEVFQSSTGDGEMFMGMLWKDIN